MQTMQHKQKQLLRRQSLNPECRPTARTAQHERNSPTAARNRRHRSRRDGIDMIGELTSAPLKILWLSPWMRPLARVYAESLAELGAEVLLITSDRHPSSDSARRYELVLDPRPKRLSTWPQFTRALHKVRQFSPHVVVTEIVRDPRWMAFAPGIPRAELVHDDQPHDQDHSIPAWERILFRGWSKRSDLKIAFSHYVAGAVGASRVVPLTSDVEESMVPQFVRAGDRRDFVIFGRMYSYKNLDVCMEAWDRHISGGGWRDDRLLLIGDGDWRGKLPKHTLWRRGQFQYPDVLPVLARAKASVVHYRQPSQSGVQVLSMQLGVTPIVSTEGALPELQPAQEEAIGIDDVEGLAMAFDALADPEQAARRGFACREHYLDHFSASISAKVLYAALSNAVDASQPRN